MKYIPVFTGNSHRVLLKTKVSRIKKSVITKKEGILIKKYHSGNGRTNSVFFKKYPGEYFTMCQLAH